MKKVSMFGVLALLSAVCAVPNGYASGKADQYADLIISEATIYTLDTNQPWADALAVKGDKIIAVGTSADIQTMQGPDTRHLSLAGKLVLPGFHDAHVHPLMPHVGGYDCVLPSPVGLSTEGVLKAVQECLNAKEDPDSWLIGKGFALESFSPEKPNKKMLDALAPKRPVFFVSFSAHNGWANSALLEEVGIHKDTPNPPNGIIEKDPKTGEPTGYLQEAAIELVYKHLPPIPVNKRAAMLRRSINKMHAVGITSIFDAWTEEEDLEAYAYLIQAQGLPLHVSTALKAVDYSENRPSPKQLAILADHHQGPGLRTHAVKIFVDGVTDGATAAVHTPYIGLGHQGMTTLSQAELVETVTELDQLGMQMKFHAIGDRAVTYVLNALQAAKEKNGFTDNRHHIDHADMIARNDFARLASLHVSVGAQFFWAAPREYRTKLAVSLVGDNWLHEFFPYKKLLDNGILLAGGSDWQISSLNPLDGIQVAVTREVPGHPGLAQMGPQHALTIEEAIRAYTLDAAWLMYQEQLTGSIEVGKFADLVVLDKNIFELPPRDIGSAKVDITVFKGKPVFVRSEKHEDWK